MKRPAALFPIALAPGAIILAPGASADDNNGGGAAAAAVANSIGDAADNHGHFVCTAAILAGGGVLSGEYIDRLNTLLLSVGTYQVAFTEPCPNQDDTRSRALVRSSASMARRFG
jgi:hypothetical protein